MAAGGASCSVCCYSWPQVKIADEAPAEPPSCWATLGRVTFCQPVKSGDIGARTDVLDVLPAERRVDTAFVRLCLAATHVRVAGERLAMVGEQLLV